METKNLLTRDEVANFLGVKIGTLATWASSKRYNLPYYKIGSKAMYKASDLEKFLENSKVGGENA